MRTIYSDEIGYGIYPGKITISNETEKELKDIMSYYENKHYNDWQLSIKKPISKNMVESFDIVPIDPMERLYFNIVLKKGEKRVDILYNDEFSDKYDLFLVEENILNKPKVHFIETFLYMIAEPINNYDLLYDDKILNQIDKNHLPEFYKQFIPEILSSRKNNYFGNLSNQFNDIVKCYYRQLYESTKQKDFKSLNNVLSGKKNIVIKYLHDFKTEN